MMRIREIVYTVTSAWKGDDAWSGGGCIPAGAIVETFGHVATDNFLARRLLVPSAESLRWCLHELEVRSPEGEVSERLIIDGGVRIGSLTDPGAPPLEFRVRRGHRVRALVENLEACQYVFRLSLFGPICHATSWVPEAVAQ